MRSHKNLHELLGIENMDSMPHEHILASGLHHPHIIALGMGLGYGLYGNGLYAHPHGGKLSKIANSLDKVFNPKRNGVSQAIDKNIVQPVEKSGNVIVNDLKTVGHYAIPAVTAGIGATLGNALLPGVGGLAGSAAGAYAGYKADQALGISGNTDFKGAGVRRKRKSKGGNLKQDLEKVWNKVPQGFHKPLEDLGKASVEYAGFKLPPKKSEGKGFRKGSKSKTRKGEEDFVTHKGDEDFHEDGHEEKGMPYEEGTGMKKSHRFVKGSAEAKAWMAHLREMRKNKVSGKGISNNSPQNGAIRVSPYSNF
jgi:hypothetical protein